jgi:hypothetical protein
MNNTPQAAPSKIVPVVIVILIFGCAGLAYWAVHLWGNLVTAETEIARLRTHSALDASLETENGRLRAQVAELKARVAKDAAALAVAPAPRVAEPSQPKSLASIASQMMNTPAMREIMARTQRTALEKMFADLMNQLGLSPEDRARFIDLVAEKRMNATEAGLKMMSGNLTPEERAALAQQMKDGNADSDTKIREFLGNDTSYAAYQDYVAQQPVRTQVTALSTSLAAAGQPMSPEQSTALATVMTETRKNFTFTHDFSDPANSDPQTMLNGPAMDTYFQEQEQLQSRIADHAAAFLSPDQVAALRQAQAARLDLTRTSMNMARQMMIPGK